MSSIEFYFSSTSIQNISLNHVNYTQNNDNDNDNDNDDDDDNNNNKNNGDVKNVNKRLKKFKNNRNKLKQINDMRKLRKLQRIQERVKNMRNNENQYHFLTADLDNKSGSPNLYSHIHNLFYTLENLYVVGPLLNKKKENATLILSFKSINDHKSSTKPSIQYMCFPLNINRNQKNENFLTGLFNASGNKTLSAIDLNELIPSSSNNEYTFDHLKPNHDMIDIDIYFYSKTTDVYYDPSLEDKNNPKAYKWITPDIQTDLKYFEPVKLKFFMDNPIENDNKENFTTLWDWEPVRESMKTVKGTHNTNLSQEEQIYIQCAPAGASEHTEMVHSSAKGGKGGKRKENNNLSFLVMGTIVIIGNILIVSLGYKMVYRVLSKFFVENVIESHGSKHADKRRGNPFEMFLYWIADIVPHFLQIQWGEGNTRTSSENLIRVFVYAFYAFLLLMTLHSLKTKNMSMFHFALFIICIYVADVFFFFIQIRNMAPEQYQTLKEEKLTS